MMTATTSDRQHPLALYAAIVLINGAILLVDISFPRGLALGVFYLGPLLLSIFAGRMEVPFVTAAICTVAMWIGYILSPSGGLSDWITEINRMFATSATWATALVGSQLIRSKVVMQERDWIRAGQTGLAAQIIGEQSVAQLGHNTLRFLAEYTGAHVGALYVSEHGDELQRTASYALDGSGLKVFRMGEGLVGEAAAQNKIMHLRELSAEQMPAYMTVRSGLVQVRPWEVVVVPTHAERTVNGVLELGIVGKVSNAAMELLALCGETIGVAIQSSCYRARLEELLLETRSQASELQVQQEELRIANQELQERGDRLRDSYEQLERQQVELEQTNAELEEQAQLLESQKADLLHTQMVLNQQAAELARASQYKSEFLANMSHELRTPLNSTLILARLLADNRERNLTEQQVKSAETIYSAGNDLLALINDILNLSSIEAGKLELKPAQINLTAFVDSIGHKFEPIAMDRQLGWSFHVDPAVPAVIETDPQRLHQILSNLLSNAFKFTEQGGVTLRVHARAGQIVFAVEDTGIGINPEQQEKIFEAFWQIDRAASRKYGGTGLGLAISRDLAHLLGGTIEVESRPGQGSEFRVVLPSRIPVVSGNSGNDRVATPQPALARVSAVLDREARSAPAATLGVPALAPTAAIAATSASTTIDDREHLGPHARSVLVIEDDLRFARIVYDLAHEREFQCLLAATADEGLILARQYAPNAIILDIGLPDDSGLGLLDRLKREPLTRHIPVHVVSISDHTETALAMGAVGYLVKPVQREDLLEVFRRLEAKLNQEVKRVLVVEDDPAHQEAIGFLLRSDDVEIVAVGTAKEALDALRTKSFDCVVADLHLPDASGGALLEAMAQDEACAFPPVIVYTGRELSADEEQELRRFSRSIIIKGVRSPERLLDEVSLFLHQVEANMSQERQRILRQVRDRDAVLEGRTILVVEDDVRNVFALTSILEPKGARIQIARNGRAALQAMERNPRIDLVLMDIMMPEMDGLEATREIRKRPEWKNLPIIALTAKAMPDDQRSSIAAGANDYIAKPIQVDKLLSLLRVWMPK